MLNGYMEANELIPAAEAVEGFSAFMTVKLLVCAFIAAVAMIIPGLSGSFVMMLLGVYNTVINAIQIKALNFYVIIPVGVGVLLGVILGAKLISTLIKKYKLMVYSVIMGLVIGSVYAILPSGFGLISRLDTDLYVCCLACLLRFLLRSSERLLKHRRLTEYN